jgi:hypothetical protein
MDALDGNSIGGALIDYFGTEMTTATGSCRHCGTRAQIAELAVYSRAPGSVIRCRACGNVVMVLVVIRGVTNVNSAGLELLDPSGS